MTHHLKIAGALPALLSALALLVAAAAPSQAQSMMPGFKLGEEKQVTPEEKERMDANERAAKAAQASVPTAKGNNDPWADVRTTPTTAAPAKKPKPVAH